MREQSQFMIQPLIYKRLLINKAGIVYRSNRNDSKYTNRKYLDALALRALVFDGATVPTSRR
jgi:hypothetical protein